MHKFYMKIAFLVVANFFIKIILQFTILFSCNFILYFFTLLSLVMMTKRHIQILRRSVFLYSFTSYLFLFSEYYVFFLMKRMNIKKKKKKSLKIFKIFSLLFLWSGNVHKVMSTNIFLSTRINIFYVVDVVYHQKKLVSLPQSQQKY